MLKTNCSYCKKNIDHDNCIYIENNSFYENSYIKIIKNGNEKSFEIEDEYFCNADCAKNWIKECFRNIGVKNEM